MCYRLRSGSGATSRFSSGTFVAADGTATPLTVDEFTIEATAEWESPRSGVKYPAGWIITVPKFEINLKVTPDVADQELDTRGTTMIVYWEGSCSVRDNSGGHRVGGRAYAELVGYDRSHDQPNLATFLVGSRFNFFTDLLPKF
jgi:predicted secreted hydrolase